MASSRLESSAILDSLFFNLVEEEEEDDGGRGEVRPLMVTCFEEWNGME